MHTPMAISANAIRRLERLLLHRTVCSTRSDVLYSELICSTIAFYSELCAVCSNGSVPTAHSGFC